MDIRHLISREEARKKIYHALSQTYNLPDKGLTELTGTLVENLCHVNPAGTSYSSLLQEQPAPEKLGELVIDFTRLFIGPYSPPAPPYGSIYLEAERKVMGDSTMDAESRYGRYGIAVAGNFKDVPDHIAAELEFMYFLIHREVELIFAGNREAVYNIIFEQQSFMNDHLSRWVPDFTDLVIQNADMPFYRSLARVTRVFIAGDAAYLNQVRIPETQNREEMQ